MLQFVGLYPNVTLEDIGTPAVTTPHDLFIYSWPLEKQAIVPGTVTALEYCFQRSTSTPVQPLFTLLLLKPLSYYGYRIAQTIYVSTRNFSFCSNRGGIVTCCERKPLKRTSRFRIPSDITAFGISTNGDNRMLGYSPGQHNSTTQGFEIPVNAIQYGYIRLRKSDITTIGYRIFNFVIGKIANSIIIIIDKQVATHCC